MRGVAGPLFYVGMEKLLVSQVEDYQLANYLHHCYVSPFGSVVDNYWGVDAAATRSLEQLLHRDGHWQALTPR